MFHRWPWSRKSSSCKRRVAEVLVVCSKERSEVPESLPSRNAGETENAMLCIKWTTTNLWEGFSNMVHAAGWTLCPCIMSIILKNILCNKKCKWALPCERRTPTVFRCWQFLTWIETQNVSWKCSYWVLTSTSVGCSLLLRWFRFSLENKWLQSC